MDDKKPDKDRKREKLIIIWFGHDFSTQKSINSYAVSLLSKFYFGDQDQFVFQTDNKYNRLRGMLSSDNLESLKILASVEF